MPETLWISHMHSDHNGMITQLIQSLWLRTRRAPLHVFGPAMILEQMADWLEKCLLFPELIGFPIEWHAVKPGRPWQHGPFKMTAFATEHLHNLASHFKRAYPEDLLRLLRPGHRVRGPALRLLGRPRPPGRAGPGPQRRQGRRRCFAS